MEDIKKKKVVFTITHMFKKEDSNGGIKHFDTKYNGPALTIMQGDYIRLKKREYRDPGTGEYTTTPPANSEKWPKYTLEIRQPYPEEGGEYLAENDYASADPSPEQSGNVKDDKIPF